MDRFQRAAHAFERLCRIMAQLRAPGGCPWDREQTIDSLKPYLVEETYEVIEAIESKDVKAHREELGDLLLQIVFQSELSQETEEGFDAAQVADAISDKLVRRHPHVFGDTEAKDAKGALRNWEAIKATERSLDSSVVDGIPRSLPGLLRAYRTGEKVAAVGFDWPSIEGALEKVHEEWRELNEEISARLEAHDEAAQQTTKERITSELGDVLFSLVNVARHLQVDPDEALRHTIEKFHHRFRYVEKKLATNGRRPTDARLDELEALWEDAKLNPIHKNTI